MQTQGLTTQEATARLKRFGPNTVATKRKMRPIVAFIKKFDSPLLLILLAVSLISFFTGNRTNAVILLCMVFLSVILDFVNTHKSEKAVDELISRVLTTATVIREGKKYEVPLTNIVPGDFVFLSAGDVIPADCRVISSNDFFINQSSLTGESIPVEKCPGDEKGSSIEQQNVVLMGTSVVTGYGMAIIEKTGKQTEFGKIAERLTEEDRQTDFERNLKVFSSFIMKLTFIMVVVVFVLNWAFGRGILDSFTFAIAIAIGLTPELLPVIMSVSLSRGAIQMSKKDVIVKHLPAIQNLGRMNILCTDKTGTLTENRIAVIKYVDAFGAIVHDVLRYSYLNSYFHTGIPNPLDQSVKDFRTFDMTGVKKVEEIPFDFERRRESVVVDEGGKRLLITKGAPEAVFPICTSYSRGERKENVTPSFQQKADQEFISLTKDGYKVLAVAIRSVSSNQTAYEKDQEKDMSFVGFIAFLDPPKSTAKEAIDELEQLGVEVKILTGDNELLTEKICRDVDIPLKGVLTGAQIDQMSDDELQKAVLATTIFARITPEQKEQIILSIQKSENVVGYLGDGINDAPALKAADVGISVNNAVDVAKETADFILLKKSLRVLKDGVIEGRKTFLNTLKYVMMGLSSNFGNMFSMMAASAFLPFLPMLPTQVLLNNFLYDTSQLSLSTDTVDPEDVRRRSSFDMKFIKKYMLVFGSISSLFDFITFGVLLLVFSQSEQHFQTGWFIESIATQVFVIYVIRTKKIPFLQSRPSAMLLINTLMAVGIAWVLPYLPFAKAFKLVPLPLPVLLVIFGIVMVYLIIAEFIKHAFFKRYRPTQG
ncbi:MAG: magnesium-translocating P-type ATPase [Patescibacteria group bacterium]|jgi:Mg2+-importing ATPase